MGITDSNVVHSIANALPTGANTIGSVNALTGATEDAAQAGQLYPLAAKYRASTNIIPAPTDGFLGRLRMSVRRALVISRDYHVARGSSGSVTQLDDMLVSLDGTQGTYAVPDVNSFVWTASTEVRSYKFGFSASGFRAATVSYRNQLAAHSRLRIKLWITGGTWGGDDDVVIYDGYVASSAEIAVLPTKPGVNATNVGYCEALSGTPAAFLVVEVVPLTAATGSILLAVGRSS